MMCLPWPRLPSGLIAAGQHAEKNGRLGAGT